MDGIEATKIIRSWEAKNGINDMCSHIPIVALTANAVAGQADIFLSNGFDDFISKPVDIRQLNAVLNKLIRDKQPPEVIEAARRQDAGKAEVDPKDDCENQEIDVFLMESFLRDANKAIAWLEGELHTGFSEEEILRKYTILVHGMKSSLWNIGEIELSKFSLKLENAGRGRDIALIVSSTPAYINQLRALTEKYETKQDDDDIDKMNISDEDKKNLCSKLLAIKEMAADYDRKGALELLAGIVNNLRVKKSIISNIMEHINHSEFEEAEKELAAYIDDLSSTI
jgi:CheY-like chemotaxis protein